MQYLPSLLTALLLSVLVFCLVIVVMNLAIRTIGGSASHFPVLPKYSPDNPALSSLDFEEFVVERFDPGHFRLMKWNKKYSGVEPVPVSDTMPDLEYQALVHNQAVPFAVECEWRPDFTGSVIDLSGFQLFPGYRKAGAEQELKVFLIIGVGGTQNAPAECYILPTEVVLPHFTSLSKDFLAPFRRQQAASVLFLDPKEMILR